MIFFRATLQDSNFKRDINSKQEDSGCNARFGLDGAAAGNEFHVIHVRDARDNIVSFAFHAFLMDPPE